MSEIFVDTIRKTGGSLGTDIRVKNTSVYESDGGTSVTQNLVQGLAKGWLKYDQDNDTIDDSQNVSSVTDNATGEFNQNHSNNMGNANYSTNVTTGFSRVFGTNRESGAGGGTPDITSVAYFDIVYNSSGSTYTNIDMTSNTTVIHGDLA